MTEDKKRAYDQTSVDVLEISVTNLSQVRGLLAEKDVKMTEIVDLPGILSMFDMYDLDNNLITFIGDPRIINDS